MKICYVEPCVHRSCLSKGKEGSLSRRYLCFDLSGVPANEQKHTLALEPRLSEGRNDDDDATDKSLQRN